MKSQQENQKAPLVWAIDPFDIDTKPSASLAKDLEKWAQSENFAIQPVYVHMAPEVDPVERASWIDRYGASIRRTMEIYLRDLGIKSTLPPLILVEHSSSQKNAVQKLIVFLEGIESPMVVISSPGRSGPERWFLGSFAENLLARFQKPVLFLTHGETSFSQGLNRILFPTDFSDRSKDAFLNFLKHAKTLGSEVILYHAISLPSFAACGYGVSGVVTATPESYFRDHEKWLKQEGQEAVETAKKLGVSARLIVDDLGIGPDFASAILKTARKAHVGLIAMASSSGPVASVLVGSIAKEVFRSNQYPVWVYGPKATEVSPMETSSAT